jgi:hypothetical protein
MDNESDKLPVSNTKNRDKMFGLSKNTIIAFLMVLVILALLGFNIFLGVGVILDRLFSGIKNIFTKLLAMLGFYTGAVINTTADIVGDTAKETIDIAEGSLQSVGNLLQNRNNVGNRSIEQEQWNLNFFGLNPSPKANEFSDNNDEDENQINELTKQLEERNTELATERKMNIKKQLEERNTELATERKMNIKKQLDATINNKQKLQKKLPSNYNKNDTDVKWCPIGLDSSGGQCMPIGKNDKCVFGKVFDNEATCKMSQIVPLKKPNFYNFSQNWGMKPPVPPPAALVPPTKYPLLYGSLQGAKPSCIPNGPCHPSTQNINGLIQPPYKQHPLQYPPMNIQSRPPMMSNDIVNRQNNNSGFGNNNNNNNNSGFGNNNNNNNNSGFGNNNNNNNNSGFGNNNNNNNNNNSGFGNNNNNNNSGFGNNNNNNNNNNSGFGNNNNNNNNNNSGFGNNNNNNNNNNSGFGNTDNLMDSDNYTPSVNVNTDKLHDDSHTHHFLRHSHKEPDTNIFSFSPGFDLLSDTNKNNSTDSEFGVYAPDIDITYPESINDSILRAPALAEEDALVAEAEAETLEEAAAEEAVLVAEAEAAVLVAEAEAEAAALEEAAAERASNKVAKQEAAKQKAAALAKQEAAKQKAAEAAKQKAAEAAKQTSAVRYRAPPTKENCLDRAKAEYGDKVTKGLNYGNWGHVPQGCSVNTKTSVAHWNDTDGKNNGNYTEVGDI